MKRILCALVLLVAVVSTALADQCDNIATCTSQPSTATTNFKLLNATDTAPALNGFTLITPATSTANSCTSASVTIGAQDEYDCVMTADSTITIGLPTTPVLGANALNTLRLRTCQDPSVGGHALTIASTGITNGIAWTKDAGMQPQPSQSTSACTLYRLTYHANLAQLIEEYTAMLAGPMTPLAAVEACPSGSFLFATSTTGGGLGDCAPVVIPANPAISATNSVGGTAGSAQPVVFEDVPSWAHFLGDATDTALGSGTQNVQGTYRLASLTVGVGATFTVTNSLGTAGAISLPRGGFVALVQGACTIHGTINAIAMTGQNQGGGPGGGGGGATATAGTAGSTNGWLGGTGVIQISPIGAGGTAGTNNGGNGTSVAAGAVSWLYENLLSGSATVGGSVGGVGATDPTFGAGGTGGNGGGLVLLDCGSIVFDGVINANGQAGANGANNATNGGGGGGGGGGGVVVLISRSGIGSITGTINVAGGNGGTGGTGVAAGGNGGSGGNGWSVTKGLN